LSASVTQETEQACCSRRCGPAVPQPAADQVLIRVTSSLNPLEYELAELNFMGRTPPIVLGLDLAGVAVAVGHGVNGVAVGDAVAATAYAKRPGISRLSASRNSQLVA
jgi:NADPH:quinone reductase-like Zn-dependent oxidoreductase